MEIPHYKSNRILIHEQRKVEKQNVLEKRKGNIYCLGKRKRNGQRGNQRGTASPLIEPYLPFGKVGVDFCAVLRRRPGLWSHQTPLFFQFPWSLVISLSSLPLSHLHTPITRLSCFQTCISKHNFLCCLTIQSEAEMSPYPCQHLL